MQNCKFGALPPRFYRTKIVGVPLQMTSTSESEVSPSESIQRVLFIASGIHVYQIPPLTSNKGYVAAQWTSSASGAREIFTARLRIIETATPLEDETESLSTDILLEDPASGELFAKAPYTDSKAVEAAIDSSRFFAVRFMGPTGERAVLGIGFEERGEALDFTGALQEARKVLGLEPRGKVKVKEVAKEPKKDYGLKPGETIKVDLDSMKKSKRNIDEGDPASETKGVSDNAALFSVRPPLASGGGALPLLVPPPSAQGARSEERRSRGFDTHAGAQEKTTADLGFDDGEFGEFQ